MNLINPYQKFKIKYKTINIKNFEQKTFCENKNIINPYYYLTSSNVYFPPIQNFKPYLQQGKLKQQYFNKFLV